MEIYANYKIVYNTDEWLNLIYEIVSGVFYDYFDISLSKEETLEIGKFMFQEYTIDNHNTIELEGKKAISDDYINKLIIDYLTNRFIHALISNYIVISISDFTNNQDFTDYIEYIKKNGKHIIVKNNDNEYSLFSAKPINYELICF